MRTIMDMLNDSTSGNLAANMARQYGLAQEQMVAVMASLMPAFAEGMRRSASDPAGFLKLMQAYAAMHQAGMASQAFNQAAVEQGNAILGQLFGSKDLSRAVAAQAAQATGLSASILKAMLPALAPAVIDGMFKQMAGGGAQNPFGKMMEQMAGGQNPWGKMLEQMMGQASGGQASINPWGKMLEGMLGGGAQGAGSTTDSPLGRMEEMFGGASKTASSGRARGEDEDSGSRKRGPLEEMIGDMFDTGRTVQRDYQKGIESIFDEFLGGMKKK